MGKAFVIPDVHLKPWMFDKASEIIEKSNFDHIVMLGDLVDDWGQEQNLDLYRETLDRALEFVKQYPDTFYCLGNHDVSYLWQALESGYSVYARDIVVDGINRIMYELPGGQTGFIHRIDNTLFSHAGLTERFVLKHFHYSGMTDINSMIEKINRMGKNELWHNDSPIWARPQIDILRMYPPDMLQVVGHTPVEHMLFEDNVLTLDNFSTYSDGRPIGDESFASVDTVKMMGAYV